MTQVTLYNKATGFNGLAGLTRDVTPQAGARDALRLRAYDLIVLDVGLPDGSGIDLLRRWRKEGSNEPVLILTARDGNGAT